MAPSVPPTPILRSWQRCRERGLPPELALARGDAPSPDAQQLLGHARSSIEDLYQLIERPGFAVLLADARAAVLTIEGDRELLALARACRLVVAASLLEETAGTNAVDLALREAQPMQTAGEEHYALCLQPLAFAAAPLFDAAGAPLGVLSILTYAEAIHPHTLGLAIAAAQALHNQLRADQLLAEANDQLAELYATLETMSEGLIFIGPAGEIRRINRRAAELLGVVARAVAGRPFETALAPPQPIRLALERREELPEHELVWQSSRGTGATLCSARPVWDRGRRYLGALITLRPAQSLHQLVHRVVGARAHFTFRDVIGQSPTMLQALHQAHMAGNGSGPVLLRGEPGVGKEIFAQAIHNASARSRGPFVGLNCAGVPRPLLAGELFGEEEGEPPARGQGSRPGKIELAHGGVLFLEEVEVLPPELQTALLRAIEMRRIIRSGGTRPLPVDVRIIATAGAEFERHVREGRFRPDLAARLSTFTVEIPPLRHRGDDLLLLVNHMVQLLGERLGRQVALEPEALQALLSYSWPGNVRELELTLERMLAGSEKSVIGLEDLPQAVARGAAPLEPPGSASLEERTRLSERDAILRAGREAAGHIGRTAALLGVSRATLWRKMSRHGIARDDFWTAS